jgi:hypothetical protein
MRSEQKVTIEVGGKSRSIRALLAVERPDRVRLVALGPAGVTLFDLYVLHGERHVVRAIRDPNDPTMSKIMEAMVGDLEAAYDLEPRPPERKVQAVGDGVIVEQPGVKVHQTARRIDIDNATLNYKVRVDVLSVETDVPLDPAMWSG